MRDSFVGLFGKSGTWWLTLILILASVLIFELGTASLRSAFFTSDEDVFQALEKDPAVKRRFEEAASSELQQGWDRKTNKERDQEERVREVVQRLEREGQERREGEVKELLRNRGVEMEELELQPVDTNRELERGFGRVREDELGRGR